MPISNQLFVRSTIALLLVGLFALLGIVGTVIYLGERSRVYFDQVIEARDARTAASDLRNNLRASESSQRGFIITGNEAYLSTYNLAQDMLPQRIESVENILKPYPAAADAVVELKSDIAGKVAEMQSTIALKREGKDAEAVAVVDTDRGKELMDRAVEFLTSIINAADTRLTEGVAEQRASAEWLRWTSIIGGVLIVLVVGGSALTVISYTRELIRARNEVAVLNAGLEQRVAERTADLQLANDEIQRFAYIVTHDLRAPLVNIMGFTSELETGANSVRALIDKTEIGDDPVAIEARRAADEDLPEAIDFIRTSTRKMDGLINAILKLSREGRRVLRPERVELKESLETAAASVQHQVAETGGEVSVEIDLPAVRTDKLSIEQIFGNLLDNAVKYRAKDRPLRVDIRGQILPANRVAITVADNGRGIADQDRERVFELFRRSGVQDQAGEGIGLAYVRTVVRNLGGDITMESQLGKGTTFTVTLPRVLVVNGSASA